MTALRILNLIVWSLVLISGLPGAWSTTFGRKPRRGDPMMLGCVSVAASMIGFSAKWLLFPDNNILWASCYALAIASAVYILLLMRVYGRGRHA